MAAGISVLLANRVFNHLTGNGAWTAPTNLFIGLHTGDPGASGTANLSRVTTRMDIDMGAAANGTTNGITQPAWDMTGDETIVFLSLHSAASGGDHLWNIQATPKLVANGDTLTLSSFSLFFATLALLSVAE